MDDGWAAWLRDLAIFGAAAAAALVLLRAVPGVRARVVAAHAAAGRWSRGRALAVVLVATALPRLAALAAFEPPYEADVREYVRKAELIADEGTPRRQEVKPDGTAFYRPLGSSLLLAGWYRATGTRGLTSARVHGVVLACGAACLLLALGRTIGRDADARLAALAYAAFLPHVVFATIPYTETFTTVLVLAVAVLFERVRRDVGGAGSAAALGLLGGWLAITRTELAWLAPLACALLLWERRREAGEALAPCVLAGAAFLVPLAVNHALRDGYPGHLRTSVQGGLILYFGNNPVAVNGYGNATPAVQERVRALYAEDPTGGRARDAALAWMGAHPGRVVANAPKKAFHLWLAEPQGFRWHAAVDRPPSGMHGALARWLRYAAYVQSLAVLAAGLLGMRLLGRERRLWAWALGIHLAVWCLLAASTRNRYPFEPFLLVAAAAWAVSGPADGRTRASACARTSAA